MTNPSTSPVAALPPWYCRGYNLRAAVIANILPDSFYEAPFPWHERKQERDVSERCGGQKMFVGLWSVQRADVLVRRGVVFKRAWVQVR